MQAMVETNTTTSLCGKSIPQLNSGLFESLEKHSGKELVAAVESVQAQNVSTNCGLFAIIYLVETLFGTSLRKTTFDHQKLRASVVNCFQQDGWTQHSRMEQPPKVRQTRAYTIDKIITHVTR